MKKGAIGRNTIYVVWTNREKIRKMLCSIIVPVFQAEKYIERCVNSIINQQFADWELILLNDGSTDNSGDICKKYAQEDSRIRYETHDNKGVSYTRNVGLSIATGDYVFFLDADDEIETDALMKIDNIINNSGSPDVVIFGYKTVLPRKYLNTFDTIPISNIGLYEKKEFAKEFENLWSRNLIHNIGTKLYKRTEAFSKNRFAENIFCQEDALFCIEALKQANNYYIMQDSLYIYHLNENTNSLNNVYRRGLMEGYREVLTQLKTYEEIVFSERFDSFFKDAVLEILNNEFRKTMNCRKAFVDKANEIYQDSVWQEFYKSSYDIRNELFFWGDNKKTVKLYFHMKKKNVKNKVSAFVNNDMIFDMLYSMLLRYRKLKGKVCK